jgi:hypothetical protein
MSKYAQEVEKLLEDVAILPEGEAAISLYEANVRASLAIAEQLERIGDELVHRRQREEEHKCQSR